MIDAHLHLGRDLVSDGRDTSEQMIMELMQRCHLRGCVVYPGNSNTSKEVEREKNREVAAFFEKHPDVLWGICQINPNYEESEFMEEVINCKQMGFRGLNINPQLHGWDAKSHHGEIVFRTARKTGMPLFINVGIGLPFGQPVKLLELCKEYKDVSVVLVHASKSYCGSQCDVLLQECPNTYLETSLGPNMRSLKRYINQLGARRVMMGSCYLSHVEHSIYSFKHCGISDEDLEWATEKTILSVLAVEGRER